MSDPGKKKVRTLGINHVVLKVGDLDRALEFYGALFDFPLRNQTDHCAFIDLADQFTHLSLGKIQGPDDKRDCGSVVDDREPVRQAMARLGIKRIDGRFNFRDPWGNRTEVVLYEDIQLTRDPHMLKGKGAGSLKKSSSAIAKLKKKGMAAPS